MTQRTRCACGSTAVGDAYLCRRCTRELAENLDALGALLDDLRTTTYRQDHLAAAGSGGFAAPDRVRPLPYKPPAARLLARAYRLVRTWSGDTRDDTPPPATDTPAVTATPNHHEPRCPYSDLHVSACAHCRQGNA